MPRSALVTTTLVATCVATLTATLTATFTAVASVPAGATPSSAARHPSVRVVHDAQHDVVGTRAPDPTQTPAPDRREGDVVGLSVRHGADAVRIRVRFAELDRPAGTTVAVYTFTVRTPKDEFATGMTVDPSSPNGETWIEKGGDFTCAGLTSRVRYQRDVATLTIPRRCLDDPAWVRVNGTVMTGAGGTTYSDTAPGRSIASERLSGRVWHPSA